MYGSVLGQASPYLGLDLRLDTSSPALFCTSLSSPPTKPTLRRSFEIEILSATLNPHVKDFDSVLLYTMQVSAGGRQYVCSKTFGELRTLVNKIKNKCNSVPRFPDMTSLMRWGSIRSGDSTVTGSLNTEYARDSMHDYMQRLFSECRMVTWLPEVHSFFWVPVSPRGSLEPILEDPSESEDDSDGEYLGTEVQ